MGLPDDHKHWILESLEFFWSPKSNGCSVQAENNNARGEVRDVYRDLDNIFSAK